jgi:hypothetical protein
LAKQKYTKNRNLPNFHPKLRILPLYIKDVKTAEIAGIHIIMMIIAVSTSELLNIQKYTPIVSVANTFVQHTPQK